MLAGSTALVSSLAMAVALQAAFAQSVTVTGDVAPPPPFFIGHWDLGRSGLVIGDTEYGELRIEAGGSVSGQSGIIGRLFGSSGFVTVTGGDSTWISEIIDVGQQGNGTLTIEDGGSVSSTVTRLGIGNANGTLNLNGTADARGVLETDIIQKGSGTAYFIIDGGILRATVDHVAFLQNFAPGDVTIASGGAFIDANGYDIGISTALSGIGGLTKQGTGTLTLSGSNTYAGGTHLLGGVIEVTEDANLGDADGPLTFDGGTLRFGAGFDLAATRSITLEGGGAYIDTNGYDIGIGTDLQGDGGLTKEGEGTLTLSGVSTYSGGTRISAGTLNVANADALGSGDITLSGTSHLRAAVDYLFRGERFSAADASTITLSAAAGTTMRIAPSVLAWGGPTSKDIHFGAPGDTGIIELGPWASWASGNLGNTYSIDAGTLRLVGDYSFLFLNSEEVTVASGATFDLNGTHAGARVLSGSGIITNGGLTASHFELAGSGEDSTFSGVMEDGAGGLSLTKSRSSGLTLSGANTYSGNTVVSGGVLRGGAANALSPNSAHTVNATLDLGGFNQTIGSLAGSGTVTNSAATEATLAAGGDNRSTTFSGMIQDGTGPVALTKIGTGTLTLTGSNSYTGNSSIVGGTLMVDGSIASSSMTTVNNGGTLGGSGTVGTTNVADGGIIAPGNSIGKLTVDGDLILSSGSVLDYELGTSGPAGNPITGISDRIDVSGNLILNGTLNLSQSGDAADGAAGLGYYRLMTYGGALTGDGLTIVPTLTDPALYGIQTGGGNVDLFIAAAGDDTLQHWQGGDGTWNTADAQWLNNGGGLPVAWAGNHAVFKNQPGGFDGGTVSVEGVQGFKGLQFVDEGYVLSGNGALQTDAAGSEIRVLADSAEIATEIAGTGGISKTQAGTLVLSGTNTYAGGTQLLGGVIEVSREANLGATTGSLTFNGGMLATTASFTSGRNATLLSDGAFDVADSTELALSGTVNGPGGLHKRGGGTLHLTGTNSYGSTRVEAGTLVGNTASISGDIANAGTVVFDEAGDATFASDIAAFGGTDGSMVKDGVGTLTLSGNSSLDWTVSEGGLVSSAGSFSGDVEIGNAGSFTFDRNDDGSYAGIISGSGDFAKDGTGTLVLSGDSSAFAGTTDVLAGDITVNGKLGGVINVTGGTLGGSGTVGTTTVASGGTIAPGNSIGTLTVDGGLTFASGSTYEVETDPAGTDSDLIHVLGTAYLNNADVAHVGIDGEYQPFSTYTILTADGGIDGEFGSVMSAYAFLAPNLDYDNNNVYLELLRNDIAFADRAATSNQKATATGIDSLVIGNGLYNAIAALPDDDTVIQDSFDQLSGEIHASAGSALIQNSEFVQQAATDRVRAAFGGIDVPAMPILAYGPGGPALAAPDTDRFAAWGQAFGSWGNFDGDGNASSLDTSHGGFVTGFDSLVTESWRLGLLAGYSHTAFDVADRASSGSSDNFHLGLYGGTHHGKLGLRAGLAYSWHDIETSRTVALPGMTERLEGDYDAGTFQAFGEAGYRIDTAAVSFEPFANLAHVSLHTDGFTETGGAAALTAASQTTDVTFTTLGLRADIDVTLGTIKAKARGMAGWRHAFGDVTPTSIHAFAGSGAFAIAGTPIAEDAAVIEAGLDLSLTETATLGIAYDGQIGNGAQRHGFNGKFSVRF